MSKTTPEKIRETAEVLRVLLEDEEVLWDELLGEETHLYDTIDHLNTVADKRTPETFRQTVRANFYSDGAAIYIGIAEGRTLAVYLGSAAGGGVFKEVENTYPADQYGHTAVWESQ